jgi:hypothetical protein
MLAAECFGGTSDIPVVLASRTWRRLPELGRGYFLRFCMIANMMASPMPIVASSSIRSD